MANTKRKTKTKIARTPSAVQELLAGWPPLVEAHREAFRHVTPDAECDALGAKTKSAHVLREAVAWCKAIDRALRDHGFALRRYGPPRFVWFLECVLALDEAVRYQRTTTGSADARRRGYERALAGARDVYADLMVALEVVAAGRADSEQRLAAATITFDDPAALVTALRALAELADELGRAYDDRTRALVASVTLRAEDAHAARAAATTIEAAAEQLRAAPATRAGDLPNTNRIEGRVLAEMRFAKRMFDRVRERNARVPRLVPGPGTRRVFA